MKTTPADKYFFFALIAIVVILNFIIFYPFLTVLVLAAAFAVVLNPINVWMKRKLGGVSWLASGITVALFVILLCGPLLFLGLTAFTQTQSAYDSIVKLNSTNTIIDSINTSINHALPEGFTVDVHAKVDEFMSFIYNNMTTLFTATLQTIVMFFFMLLAIFYILKDGESWKQSFIKLSPLSETDTQDIFSKLGRTINSVLKGSFVVAIAQGIFSSIGFTIFGVPNPILWGMAAGIASFIPTIGTALISVPAMLFLFFTGMHLQAFGLLIWSIALMNIIDNFLSPYIIGKNADMPSFFILFSILGGIAILGPVGILIGPIILSLLYSLISIHRKESQV